MPERLFYIQDARSYIGDAVLWWRANRQGYTTDINQAGRYPEAETRNHRPTDKAWPCDVVDSMVPVKVIMAAQLTAVDGEFR